MGSRTPSDYRKFYHCPNPKKLSPNGGQPEGYVNKDGTWAAIPIIGSETKLCIIHNGEHMHTARNYKDAMSYIKKQIALEKKLKKKGSLEKFL
tara:strand:- start:123 stop:401 length:279 start_codon:yes stop_codon:yes gene_type:complete